MNQNESIIPLELINRLSSKEFRGFLRVYGEKEIQHLNEIHNAQTLSLCNLLINSVRLYIQPGIKNATTFSMLHNEIIRRYNHKIKIENTYSGESIGCKKHGNPSCIECFQNSIDYSKSTPVNNELDQFDFDLENLTL